MSAPENIALMKRWFEEVWNQGRMETVRELLDENATGFGQAGHETQVHGPADFIPFAQRLRGAFPDIKTTVEDVFGDDQKCRRALVRKNDSHRRRLGDPSDQSQSAHHRDNPRALQKWKNHIGLGQLGSAGDAAPAWRSSGGSGIAADVDRQEAASLACRSVKAKPVPSLIAPRKTMELLCLSLLSPTGL